MAAEDGRCLTKCCAGAPSTKVLDLGSGTGEHARFIEGDMRDLAGVVEEGFGAAICVGNALPHLSGDDDLTALTDLRPRRLP